MIFDELSLFILLIPSDYDRLTFGHLGESLIT
jgi:hypothetical protein